MRTCILGIGLQGVWRLQRVDFESCDDNICKDIADDFPTVQPEYNNAFTLVELSLGKACSIHVSSSHKPSNKLHAY